MQKFTLLIMALFSQYSYAVTCPNIYKAPLCPDSGSTLLDETYPTQAFVISNSAVIKNVNSDKVSGQYIAAIAKSYNYENMPQVLVPVENTGMFDKVIEQVRANLKAKNVSEVKIEKFVGQISHVPAREWTWQQDYFESFINPETGSPVLRHFEGYYRVPKTTTAQLAEKGRDCQIFLGPTISSQYTNPNPNERSFGSGEMGGNVEGAPGGLCLTGDNQSMVLAKSYCGKEENVLRLQTSWLNVGHVDEIFKVIPSQFNDGRPKECQFSIMAASPKKALELMKEGANSRKPFFEFDQNLSDEEYKETLLSRSSVDDSAGSYGNVIICEMIKRAYNENKLPVQMNRQRLNQNRNVFYKFLLDNALADAEVVGEKKNFKCEDYIESIPADVLHDYLLDQKELFDLNSAIQDSIDADKRKIKEKILMRLPQCTKYYDEVDVPDLFYGMKAMYINGRPTLPKDSYGGGAVNSFFPNPTNSVLMNRSILLPESGSGLFDNYVKNELKKRKIETIAIDSWDYAHVGNGNIHCSSHSIPYCKPRGKK